jgi:hypothetical protein
MNILDYFKSLLPSFGQDSILDDLARLRAETNDVLLPSLAQAEEAFQGHTFKSEYAKGIEATLKRRFQEHGPQATLFSILDEVYKGLPAHLDMLDKLVEASFAKDVDAETLSYRKTNILKYIETVNFSVQYAVRVILRVIRIEGGAEGQHDASLHYAEKIYLDHNYSDWIESLSLVDQSAIAVETALSSIPEIGVDEHVQGALDVKKLDPLKLNFINPVLNPIYHVRMRRAEKTVADVNRAKEERKLVELRLHEYKARKTGKPDPVLEGQIEKIEDRLKSLDRSIAHMSE